MRLLAAAFVVALTVTPVQADDAYYLLMFGSQRLPRNPNYAHSYATFVRATCPTNDCAGSILEVHTISWLPADLVINTLSPFPKCGHNFELHETLRYTLDTRQHVSMWGPYRIEPELYFLALEQKARLESGGVRYIANDMGRNTERTTNCIHACANVVAGPRLRVLSPGWGDTASYFILLAYQSYLLNPDEHHYWVGSALGLDDYPIAYRDNPPRGGPFLPLTGVRLGNIRARASYGPPR